MIRHGWTDYIPSILWAIICARGLYTWRRNARKMKNNLTSLRGNEDTSDQLSILFARADQLMDNLRAFAFLNGLMLGLLSFFFIAGAGFTKNLTFLRIYSDYTLAVLVGSFAIFAFNGEIYSYVLDKVQGRRS